MSRFFGLLVVLAILVASMGFAAANAGNTVTLNLGLFTLYRVPVTLVAFSGLFVGMIVMFLTGVHTDLKVRGILRERLHQEAQEERTWTDKNQQDLFSDSSGPSGSSGDPSPDAPASSSVAASPAEAERTVPEGPAATPRGDGSPEPMPSEIQSEDPMSSENAEKTP